LKPSLGILPWVPVLPDFFPSSIVIVVGRLVGKEERKERTGPNYNWYGW
jgi:hypothetical protein